MGYIKDYATLDYALKRINYHNHFVWYGIPKTTFEIPEIIRGLDAPFNSDEEKVAKKMLVAASTEAIMSNPGIPQNRKERMARKNADEIQQAFDLTKLEIAPMSKPERERRERENVIAGRVKMFNRGKAILKRTAVKKGINLAVATLVGTTGPVGVVAGVAYGIFTLMPDKVKKEIKNKTVDVIDKSATKVENIVEKVKETPFGKKMTTVCNDIKNSKTVTAVREVVKEVAEEAFTRVATKVKDGAKRAWSFVKSLF